MENGNENPEDANEHYPGPQLKCAGKSDSCEDAQTKRSVLQLLKDLAQVIKPHGICFADLVEIAERMATMKYKILVLSGKGGVGKSTFSAQLSFALAGVMDYQVGLLDIDICEPSMLGLEGQEVHRSNLGLSLVYVEDNLGVMSIRFMHASKRR
ncbi:hypothetical protein IFM89_027806 [Coptis chinensis]|uniref:Cytosolic Fe-S cluster assembly factor NBP35 n=1 Tax=Coptis chinensis TaxID=261450 RepID=A0A835IYU2_9MAGN|nr:hypothetical protein IFM89_027806 [Coptis chinensis]